jgi:hypothetical protein
MATRGWTFVYNIELSSEQNPPGTMDRLREELRKYFVEQGIEYGMGALGGSRHCYGTVHAADRPTAEKVRQDLSEWVKTQPFSGIARFDAANETEAALLEPITDLVCGVDNLTEDDRAEAARYYRELRKRIESRRPS